MMVHKDPVLMHLELRQRTTSLAWSPEKQLELPRNKTHATIYLRKVDMIKRVDRLFPQRFPLEGAWGSTGEQEVWRAQLERMGLENVRMQLFICPTSSGGTIAIGDQAGITKEFVEKWVIWHEQKKLNANVASRARLAWRGKISAFSAVAVTTILQALLIYLFLK